MGQEFLIDTNIIIAALEGQLPKDGADLVKGVSPNISVITQIELLGWHGATSNSLVTLNKFVNTANIFALDSQVTQQTIVLRQQHKVKTPDAIIAATALIYKMILISRNVSDFAQFTQLKVLNPFNIDG